MTCGASSKGRNHHPTPPSISQPSCHLESPPLGMYSFYLPEVSPSGDEALLLNRAGTGKQERSDIDGAHSEDGNVGPPAPQGSENYYILWPCLER